MGAEALYREAEVAGPFQVVVAAAPAVERLRVVAAAVKELCLAVGVAMLYQVAVAVVGPGWRKREADGTGMDLFCPAEGGEVAPHFGFPPMLSAQQAVSANSMTVAQN